MAETPTLRSLLRSRIRGALLGGAVGDALGFPFEGSTHAFMSALGADVMKAFEAHRSGYFPAGQFSENTQMTLSTVEAILAAKEFSGREVAKGFLPLWRENRVIGRSTGCTEAISRLLGGTADWRTSGCEEGWAGSGAAERAVPLGLWNYDEAQQLIEQAVLAAEITHRDPRAVAGAVGVAAAAAYSLTHREIILGDWLDEVGGAMTSICPSFAQCLGELPRILSLGESDALNAIEQLGKRERSSETRGEQSSSVVPTIMTAFYWFLRFPDEWVLTVCGCLRSGGDVSTIAAIGAGISGAFNGDGAIPDVLRQTVVDRDRILQLADRLHNLKESQRQRSSR